MWNEPGLGHVISVTTTFNENVTVTGSPQLTIVIAGANRDATYKPGKSTSTKKVFGYAIHASNDSDLLDTNGISIGANALSLNGGTITDLAGNGVLTQSDNDTITHSQSDPLHNANFQVKDW